MREMNRKFKQAVLALSLMAMSWLPAGAVELSGDVDGNGVLEVVDVVKLIDYLLTGDATVINVDNADVDGDGIVSISDVTDLIDVILLSSLTPADNHDWVDLGLPSGTIWATRNVGASSPEDYGDYFAWGETEPKDYYDWNTYKWCNGNLKTLTKYCNSSFFGYNGFVDNKTELDAADDAACAHYPGGRMPSREQIQELFQCCSWQWTQRNGVNGRLFTGPNGNTMFLPAAGYRWYDSLDFAGSHGFFWSRTLYSSCPIFAYYLDFSSEYVGWDLNDYRTIGHTVRAVRVTQN